MLTSCQIKANRTKAILDYPLLTSAFNFYIFFSGFFHTALLHTLHSWPHFWTLWMNEDSVVVTNIKQVTFMRSCLLVVFSISHATEYQTTADFFLLRILGARVLLPAVWFTFSCQSCWPQDIFSGRISFSHQTSQIVHEQDFCMNLAWTRFWQMSPTDV